MGGLFLRTYHIYGIVLDSKKGREALKTLAFKKILFFYQQTPFFCYIEGFFEEKRTKRNGFYKFKSIYVLSK